MFEQIHRHWLRFLGRKNYPHALVYDKVCAGANIEEGAWIPFGTRIGKACSIGRYSYIMPPCHLEHVSIGNFCSIAEGVKFLNKQHNISAFSSFPFSARLQMHGVDFPPMFEERIHKGNINVEHDVWIGTGAVIMGGVSIGSGAVIAAGSVVTKDVAPYAIMAGVPARKIRSRFSDEAISQLLNSQWWTWSLAEIQARQNELANMSEL